MGEVCGATLSLALLTLCRDEQQRLANLKREREEAEIDLTRRIRIETTLVRPSITLVPPHPVCTGCGEEAQGRAGSGAGRHLRHAMQIRASLPQARVIRALKGRS